MACKDLEDKYPKFASEPHNVRLCLASDGFDPFGMMNVTCTTLSTWDAKLKRNFTLRVVLLWTINDFPAYGMPSGWSPKGKFACPYCHKDTEYSFRPQKNEILALS
ncbi:hypothetical protein U9M48_018711 [Paspalum notatum var. saurae]|uniref:Uncharacterized protein n=1 Tax=Paspalum notatum var. saurae TaxID=547442 RepID=A0AAQ3WQ25_PASNO